MFEISQKALGFKFPVIYNFSCKQSLGCWLSYRRRVRLFQIVKLFPNPAEGTIEGASNERKHQEHLSDSEFVLNLPRNCSQDDDLLARGEKELELQRVWGAFSHQPTPHGHRHALTPLLTSPRPTWGGGEGCCKGFWPVSSLHWLSPCWPGSLLPPHFLWGSQILPIILCTCCEGAL